MIFGCRCGGLVACSAIRCSSVCRGDTCTCWSPSCTRPGWPVGKDACRHAAAVIVGGRPGRDAGQHPQVVLEATYGWYWAVDVLQAAGAEVHLAHPLGVKAFTYRRVKNDVRDATDLADLLRM